MPKFRKKPVVVDAVQWTGDNLDELFKLGDFKLNYTYINNDALGVYTIDGSVCWPSVGDWVIMGPYGKFYTCKKDIFKETYEEVTDA